MRNNKNRVIVFGLDGGTFALLQPIMDVGKMPYMKQIIERGVSGILNSTIPPITAPAWTSFATGKNPGKHGIYDFVVKGSNNMVMANSRMIIGKKIWNILSDHKKKVGIINFPISYPLEEVNGFMISGFISPLNAKTYSYPPELFSQIGDYVINVKALEINKRRSPTKKEILQFIEKIMRAIELRYKAFRYLIEKNEWDFIFILFMEFDKLQHALWKYLEKDEPQYNKGEIYEYILKCYQRIDAILGEIFEEMDDKTSLIIVSDHGFCSKNKYFFINLWLNKNGYLNRNLTQLIIDKIKEKTGFKNNTILPSKITDVLRNFGLQKINAHFSDLFIPPSHEILLRYINLLKTKAYCPSTSSQGIFINLKNRDRYGIVEEGDGYNRIRKEIRDKLLALKDEETGKNIFENIYFSEQIYHGPALKYAPDLILSPADGYVLLSSLMNLYSKNLVKVTTSEGTHHPDGIFIAVDKKIIKNDLRIDNTNIIDIAPTILYLMGLSIPSDMDGKVVTSIFKETFLESNPPVFSDVKDDDFETTRDEVFTADDEKQIIDELKGLGYLG